MLSHHFMNVAYRVCHWKVLCEADSCYEGRKQELDKDEYGESVPFTSRTQSAHEKKLQIIGSLERARDEGNRCMPFVQVRAFPLPSVENETGFLRNGNV